jgi:rubrerythrin
MGAFGWLRRVVQRLILRNALALEEQIAGHFEDLPEELAGLELPPALAAMVAEEREHRRLLRELIAGRLPEQELEKALVPRRVHAVHEVRPLGPAYAPLLDKLRHIAEHERSIYEFFRSLRDKSKLPVVKRTFGFLTEQEEVHLRLLERLLAP